MNVGELLRERDRLLGVIEEAKTARSRLRQINVLITMYGDDEKVSLVTEMVTCPKCGKEVKKNGLPLHNRRVHGSLKGSPAKKATGLRRVS